MFDNAPEALDEKPLTLSFDEAMRFTGLDRTDLYSLLTAHRIRRTGGIAVERLRRAIERGGER